jgi:hypothetical protein
MMNPLRFLATQIIMTSAVVCFSFHVLKSQISTQVGIGALYVNGDVDPVFDPLNSFHLGLNKRIYKNFNAELKFGFGKTVGLSGSFMQSAQNGGGLIEPAYADLDQNVWYPNYLSTHVYTDLGVNYILNTGLERLRFIGGAGIGFSISSVNVNLLGLDSSIYSLKLPVTTNLEEAKDIVDRSYDSTYETKFDEAGFAPHLSIQLGIQFKITRGIYFSIDARHHFAFSDYLDSIKNISATEASGNNDAVSIFTIGFVGYLLPDEKEQRGPVK